MEFIIPTDVSTEKEIIVENKHVAEFLGVDDIAVLSTPAMIQLFEHVSRIKMDTILPSGFTTVGTEIHIKHLTAVPRGEKIIIKSKLLEQKDRNLVFKVEAVWKNKIIGEGIIGRFIVNKERFLARLKNSLANK
jgi:predicted thioesterase